MAGRIGSAKWLGDVRTGAGELTVGEHAWTGAYSGSSRFGGVLPGFGDGAGTNPEELLAAAHAACFTMALSLALTEGGSSPRLLHTQAKVHLRFIDGAPRIQQIDLTTEGDVPGLDEPVFRERAEEAKRSCIISRALSGVEQINVVARLAAQRSEDSPNAAALEGSGNA
jgi:lipoyl-dependent peroxiredoxin